jgi:hypothetical protein
MPPAHADDVAIRYQILNTLQGANSGKWSFELQLSNLSGAKLTQLSIGVLTTLSSPFSDDQVFVGELAAAGSRSVTAELAVPIESLAAENRSLRFYLDYATADGERRSAVIQGESTVFARDIYP